MLNAINNCLKFWVCLFLIGSAVVNVAARPYGDRDIKYTHLANFRALMAKPSGPGPFPVVIYSYDEFYDWGGKELSDRRGYNLETIVSYFSDRGYVCVIPLERYRKVNAIIGAALHMNKLPYVKPNEIHLIGMSEGAFMNVLAAQKLPMLKSMTCIAPIIINNKGYLSVGHFLHKRPQNPDLPVLFLSAYDVKWRIEYQKKVLDILSFFYDDVRVKTYMVKKQWFWDVSRSYMDEVHEFIKGTYNKEHDTSTHTY